MIQFQTKINQSNNRIKLYKQHNKSFINQVRMSKSDKKSTKQQAKRLQQIQRQDQQKKKQEQQKRMKQQLQKLQQQQDKLRKTSSPLVQLGLLDAYEFFLKHLAQNGIPQANVFEFAAQSVLKFEKRIKKKEQQLKNIEEYNRNVIESQKNVQPSPVKRKPIKPSMLPFKGDINQDQLNILNKISSKNKTNQTHTQGYQQQSYQDDD